MGADDLTTAASTAPSAGLQVELQPSLCVQEFHVCHGTQSKVWYNIYIVRYVAMSDM